MPKLLDNWKQVLKKSWAVRASGASAAFSALFLAWPTVLTDIWQALPPALMALLPQQIALSIPLLLSLATIWIRVVQQGHRDEQ